MTDGQADAVAMEGDQETGAPAQQTSLRYLRLQNGFRNMLKSGMDRLDQQTFMERFKDHPNPGQLQPLWRILKKQCEVILQVAAAEAEAACDEVGVQQQLRELESLILQRGLMGTDSSAEATAALPSAAEAAARVAAMQAEKQLLQQQLQELQQQRAAVDAELQARQAAADDVLQQFDKDIAEPVDKVYTATKQWVQTARDGILQELDAMQP